MRVTRFAHATGPFSRPSALGPGCGADETLVLVFGAPALDQIGTGGGVPAPDPFVDLRSAFPGAVVVGCSSSGHLDDTDIADEGFCGVAVQFEHTTLALASTRVADRDDSFAAGSRLAAQLDPQAADGRRLSAVLLLSDGVVVNGSQLVRGLGRGLPPGTPQFGGLAGDHAQFTRTWVLAGDELGPGVVAAVGFYGDRLWVTHGTHGGWESFGPTRTVTRSEGNRLFELDGRPALELYKSYLGSYAADLPGSALHFPLDVHAPDTARSVVRTVLAVDEADQSLTFAGDVPVGSEAQLMRSNHDMLIDGAQAAAEQCAPVAAGTPAVAITVTCVGRRLVLGERAEEELEAVRDVLGAGVELVGFYSNGEVAPVEGFSDLHNQTMTLAILAEV